MRPALRACALLVVAAAAVGCPPARPPVTGPPRGAPPAPPVGVITWPRMRADAFGCLLETRYGVRDPRWGCARPDPGPKGDPCLNTRAYYAGPAFPPAAAATVAPGVVEIRLAWEHRDLQALVIELRGALTDAAARRRLGLPDAGAALPPNVQRLSVQRCAPARTCVELVAFDHLGAGDVECPQ